MPPAPLHRWTAATPNVGESSWRGPTLVIGCSIGVGVVVGDGREREGLGELLGADDVQQIVSSATTTRPTTRILGSGYSSRHRERTAGRTNAQAYSERSAPFDGPLPPEGYGRYQDMRKEVSR